MTAASKTASALDLWRKPDTYLQSLHCWTPSVPYMKSLRKKPASSLRVACILEDRLHHGLRHECRLLPLTPHNWKETLTHAMPDFLLMESTWLSSCGHWKMAQSPASDRNTMLLEILSLARKMSIPSVFWFTRGHEYHDHFQDFAKHFDCVFCADPMEIQNLQREGVKAEILLPCMQPSLFNPFRKYSHYHAYDLGIIFDGWADLEQLPDNACLLEDLKEHTLSIIESQHSIFKNRLKILPELSDHFLGYVTLANKIIALKYARAYASFGQTLSCQTTRQWMALEAAACRLPVVHLGSLPDGDIRSSFARVFDDDDEFLMEFMRMVKDDLYRQRIGHQGWREVNMRHGFSHRLQTICQNIGIACDLKEFPKVSMIVPSYRKDMLPRSVDTFLQQTYPNKELVVVFNGDAAPSMQDLGLAENRDDIKILHLPRDFFAAGCLNYGQLIAGGEYFFRLDDDDCYSPNYILDMMLNVRAANPDFFGKPPSPVVFDGDNTVYARMKVPPLCIVPQNLLASGEVRIGGNSMAGSKSFFARHPWDDSQYAAADSAMLFNLEADNLATYAIMDNLNMVAVRRKDQKTHTWRIDQDKITRHATTYICSDLIV